MDVVTSYSVDVAMFELISALLSMVTAVVIAAPEENVLKF